MLEILNKSICYVIMYLTGYFIIKAITKRKVAYTMTTFLYILLLWFVSVFSHKTEYQAAYSIAVFLFNIVVYKKVFNIQLSQSAILCAIFMAIMTIADIGVTSILRIFYTQDAIRSSFVLSIIANLLISIASVGIINIKVVRNKIKKFYFSLNDKKVWINISFLVLLIIGFYFIVYNIANNNINEGPYITNLVILIIFSIITYIYIDSRNEYKTLSEEYDNLFSYVQNFEEWIDKEQLNRHEYKNQLAVLRNISKDKKVNEKIDEILEDTLSVKDTVISNLKNIPNGGLKGLLYYKSAIAQKNNINLSVDVSLKKNSWYKKLQENQIKDLCKLVGIYFDNAIEAAVETKEKYIMIEIYEIKDMIKIVISNSYQNTIPATERNLKGVSSKGENRGNGLYFAKNIISKNKWLEDSQEEMDNLYIQTLIIKK